MNRVLLVDFESADREAGKASLTEMGCMVTSFGGNFEFHSVLELQNARAIRRNDGIILSLGGNAVVPFKGSVKDWGRTYQMPVETAPYPIEQEA